MQPLGSMDISSILNNAKLVNTGENSVLGGPHYDSLRKTPLSPFSSVSGWNRNNSSSNSTSPSLADFTASEVREEGTQPMQPWVPTFSAPKSCSQTRVRVGVCRPKRRSLEVSSNNVQRLEGFSKRRKCESCMKTFYSSTHLDIHEETVHKGIKRHKCSHCSSSFGQSGTLTRHILTVHEKRRDHECKLPNCRKRFSSAWSLKVHVQNVHFKLRPYGCSVPSCSRAFGNLWNRRKHERNVHGIQRDSPSATINNVSANRQGGINS